MVVPIYIPTSSVGESPSPHTPSSMYCFAIAILAGVRCCLIVVSESQENLEGENSATVKAFSNLEWCPLGPPWRSSG